MPPSNPLAAPPIAPSAFPPKSIAPSISIPPIGDSNSSPNGAPIPDAINAPPRTFEPICAIPLEANFEPILLTALPPIPLTALPIPPLASFPTPPLANPPIPFSPPNLPKAPLPF